MRKLKKKFDVKLKTILTLLRQLFKINDFMVKKKYWSSIEIQNTYDVMT
jgi:hypothetical protein